MSNQSPCNFQTCTRCPHGFRKKPGTLKNVKSPGAKLRSKWRLNADDFFSLDGIEINFCDEKNSQKASIKVLSRKLNLPAGDQSEHTDEHGCLQHGQIFLIKSEPLI